MPLWYFLAESNGFWRTEQSARRFCATFCTRQQSRRIDQQCRRALRRLACLARCRQRWADRRRRDAIATELGIAEIDLDFFSVNETIADGHLTERSAFTWRTERAAKSRTSGSGRTQSGNCSRTSRGRCGYCCAPLHRKLWHRARPSLGDAA